MDNSCSMVKQGRPTGIGNASDRLREERRARTSDDNFPQQIGASADAYLTRVRDGFSRHRR